MVSSNFDYQIFSSASSLFNKSETNAPFFLNVHWGVKRPQADAGGSCDKPCDWSRAVTGDFSSCSWFLCGCDEGQQERVMFRDHHWWLVWHNNMADEPHKTAALFFGFKPSLVKYKNLDLICKLIYRHVTTLEHVLLCENVISRSINCHDLSKKSGWNISKHQNASRKWDDHPYHNITW